jgi:SAM-dependent methyltransferase
MTTKQPGAPSAQYFDEWYANMAGGASRDDIQQRHLGLPPRLPSTSLLTWEGIGEVVDALHLRPGERLLDLACGRGGYGLEIAARTGAKLTGVDFAAAAIAQATELARQSGADAEFHVGDLADTGLASGSVDALVCVDAIQFKPIAASFDEMRRVLVPGGRLALTTWEALDPDDERVPERIRAVDTAAGLTAAGFVDVQVRERPQWRAAERAMWEEAAALDPGGDADLQSLHDEGVGVLGVFDLIRRVFATATAA